jgi:hypothetical protein
MAPHLTMAELDQIRAKSGAGKSPVEIHRWLASYRRRKGWMMPNLTNVRKVLRGKSYRVGLNETRGRKEKVSKKTVRKLDGLRKALIKKAKGEKEVHWGDVLR